MYPWLLRKNIKEYLNNESPVFFTGFFVIFGRSVEYIFTKEKIII